jgi:hypothetical protein
VTDELVAFVDARLDEDEAAARAATPGPWRAITSTELEELRNREPVDEKDEDPRPWTRPVMSEDESRSDGDRVHIARHDPVRALREVEAKRAIITAVWQYEAQIDGEWGCCHNATEIAAGYCPEHRPDEIGVLRHLAAVYRDHPDYRPGWKP